MGSTAIAVFVLLGLSACGGGTPKPQPVKELALQGLASWYGEEFAGRPTANGEIFDPNSLTAAHRSLPFGTILAVTNLKNQQTVEVRINDRGPFVGNRIIDLSYGAAAEISMVEDGISEVSLEILRLGKGEREPPKPYEVTIDSGPKETIPEPEPPKPQPVDVVDEPAGSAPLDSEPIESEKFPETRSAATEPVEETSPPPRPARPLSPPPPSRPATSDDANAWKVQLGAFSIRENAENLTNQIRAMGLPVAIDKTGSLHRVRSGPFASRAQAIDALERIEAAGYEGMIISPAAN